MRCFSLRHRAMHLGCRPIAAGLLQLPSIAPHPASHAPACSRADTISMLERALKDVHFSVDPKRPAKAQALEVRGRAWAAGWWGGGRHDARMRSMKL